MRLQRWVVEDGDDHVTAPDDRGEWVRAEDAETLEDLVALIGRQIEVLREEVGGLDPMTTELVSREWVDDKLLEILDVVHDRLTVPQHDEIERRSEVGT